MKILFINSVYKFGSTGRLVEDLMKSAQENNHEVLCAYGRHKQKPSDDTFYFGSDIETFWHVAMTRLFGRHGLHSSKSTQKLIHKIKEFNPDVIHLHNLHGYYLNIPMLMKYLKTLDVKIVWTLHDTWSISGSAAYFDYHGCKVWDEGCVECNVTREYPEVKLFPNQRRNFKWKKETFLGFKNLTIITVSDWLKDLIKASFLKEYQIKRIYNGIDLDIFHLPSKPKIQSKPLKLLGVANDWEARKGLQDFIKLSEKLDEQYHITLIGLSNGQVRELPQNIEGIERTSSLEELIKYYQDADIYLNLSVEETMGLTTVEAKACGTPCIVYDRTAVPEIVDDRSGVIVKANDIDALIKSIKTFDFDTYNTASARLRALYFSKEKMLDLYLNEYDKHKEEV